MREEVGTSAGTKKTPGATTPKGGTHVGAFAMLNQDKTDHAQCRKHLDGEEKGKQDIHQKLQVCVVSRGKITLPQR